jgi:hypothetical protein
LVATVSRALVAAVLVLAAIGLLKLLRVRAGARAPLALAAAPLALFATGNYEGELLFRIYLFGLPFLAFLAAHAFLFRAGTRWRLAAPSVTLAVTSLLLGGLLVAYYGKERQYYYSPEEVAAARHLYSHAPPGSLVVEGTRSYPGQFLNYERYEYVTLSREPPRSQARVVAHPRAVLGEWMTARSRGRAFLIITRSQKAEVAEQGTMPPRSLGRIERALARSPRFRTVTRNDDAVVFAPARGALG